MSINPPASTPSGKLMVVATIVAKPGKDAIVQEYLKKAQERANSDEEPGTYTYRVTRRVDAEGKHLPVFVIVEEYAGTVAVYFLIWSLFSLHPWASGAAGMMAHAGGPPLVAFIKAAQEQDIVEGGLQLDFLDGAYRLQLFFPPHSTDFFSIIEI
ncbi:hypothetical protein D9757_009215 [Collybiopsis confluens]|uniref:ABM domain-containing protein n=1 Tax=Collybiopsis confluens TaxID=2823264 RepID=A0A8H5M3Q8_9AGAR|nr:hypothetical protein D9757_009215 [Collybiopsis confluens]